MFLSIGTLVYMQLLIHYDIHFQKSKPMKIALLNKSVLVTGLTWNCFSVDFE